MRQILHMIPQVSVVLATLATELACSASSEHPSMLLWVVSSRLVEWLQTGTVMKALSFCVTVVPVHACFLL